MDHQIVLETCHQFCIIGPTDIKGNKLKESLTAISNQKFNKDDFIAFVQTNMRKLNHQNCRLLFRIKTEYFWNGAANIMLLNVGRDSGLLSAAINTLISRRNGVIKLTKYQVYLIISNMFLGTLPQQLFNRDPSFGSLMSVRENEDEITCRDQLEFRLNKLKSIVRFICVFAKRSAINQQYGRNQYVIFQRHSLHPESLLDDSINLCEVHSDVGEFYNCSNEIDSISMNRCSTPLPGSQVFEVSGNNLTVQDKIVYSHTQMLIMCILLYDALQQGQVLIVHGAEKYSHLNAVNPYEPFNFNQGFQDKSEIDVSHQCKKTTFVFFDSMPAVHNVPYQAMPDLHKIYSAMKGCATVHPTSARVVTGKQELSHRRSGIPWEINFLIEWMGVSAAGWKSLTFYVEDHLQAIDLKIMVQELKQHSLRDLLAIIEQFNHLRLQERVKIKFCQYLQDIVL